MGRVRIRDRLPQAMKGPASFSAAKQRLLAQWREGRVHVAADPLVARRRGAAIPLSVRQLRAWSSEQGRAATPANTLWFCAGVDGPLDLRILDQAVRRLGRRHEALRSAIRVEGGAPRTVVEPAAELVLEVVEPDSALPQASVERASEVLREPFRLDRPPLARVVVVRSSPRRHLLLVLAHRIVCDGWSLGIGLSEVASAYSALASGRLPSLPELPVQHADFVLWQKGQLERGCWEPQFAYWKDRFSSAGLLGLPYDRPRPSRPGMAGGAIEISLSERASASLRDFCRSEGISLFMLLLAGGQVLLHQASGSDRVALLSNTANRGHREIQGLMGLFINTVLMETDLSGDPTVRQLLARVREVCSGAYANQDLPFETILERLDLDMDGLSQAAMVLHNWPMPATSLAGLRLEPIELDLGLARFDLFFNLWDRWHRILGQLSYRSALFDRATVQRLAHHFVVLLGELSSHPERRLSQLSRFA
jgi:Condensation domain